MGSIAARPPVYRGKDSHDSLAKEVRPTVRHLFEVLCQSHPTAAQLKVWAFLVGEIALDSRVWDAVSSYRIGEVTGLDRSNVRRALRDLEQLGVIEIQRGGTERKGRPQLSVIGFGPGALGPPLPEALGPPVRSPARRPKPGAITTEDRGLFVPETGGATTPRQEGPQDFQGGGASPPSAGASGARSAESRFVEAWDQSGCSQQTETMVKRMAKESGATWSDLWDLRLVSSLNSMIHLNEEAADRYRPLEMQSF